MTDKVNLVAVAEALTERWSPRVVASLDDSYVKVAKVQGQLAWHAHTDEDELFVVLRGRLVIQLRDRDVVLGEGDSFVVPKGVEHNPVADEECLILLIEKQSTLHTGDVRTPLTRSLDEQLRPL